VPLAATPDKKAGATPESSQVCIEYSFYSCPRKDALEIVSAWPEIETPWNKLQALLRDKNARCEHVSSVVTKSGQRMVVEEMQAIPFATSYSPVLADGSGGKPLGYELRNTGITIELEPVISPDGLTVDINHITQIVTPRGPLEFTGSATHFPSAPVVETRRMTTSGEFAIGKQVLVGTCNPPPANGVNNRANDDRTWFLFVHIQPNAP